MCGMQRTLQRGKTCRKETEKERLYCTISLRLANAVMYVADAVLIAPARGREWECAVALASVMPSVCVHAWACARRSVWVQVLVSAVWALASAKAQKSR